MLFLPQLGPCKEVERRTLYQCAHKRSRGVFRRLRVPSIHSVCRLFVEGLDKLCQMIPAKTLCLYECRKRRVGSTNRNHASAKRE